MAPTEEPVELLEPVADGVVLRHGRREESGGAQDVVAGRFGALGRRRFGLDVVVVADPQRQVAPLNLQRNQDNSAKGTRDDDDGWKKGTHLGGDEGVELERRSEAGALLVLELDLEDGLAVRVDAHDLLGPVEQPVAARHPHPFVFQAADAELVRVVAPRHRPRIALPKPKKQNKLAMKNQDNNISSSGRRRRRGRRRRKKMRRRRRKKIRRRMKTRKKNVRSRSRKKNKEKEEEEEKEEDEEEEKDEK